MTVQKFSISLDPRVVDAVALRGSERSTTINKSLERYFYLLDQARRDLIKLLDDHEMGMILDVLNGTGFFEPMSLQLVWGEIEDSLPDGYAGKWEIDGPALIEKLKRLSLIENVALVDAVERWWERIGNGEKLEPGEALKK